MKNLTPLALYLKVLCLAGIVSVSFATAFALTISPARLEIGGDPGKVVTSDFTITNEQDTEQTFFTSVENFAAQGETGTPSFSPSKEGLASWVQVIDKVTLKKGEKIKVPFTITIPKDADVGGHFAAIFLSTTPPTQKSGQVSVGAKMGMLILLRVTGDIKEGGGLLSFGLKNGGHFATALPIDFEYRFNNSGNDRVNPKGTITIHNTIGFKTQELNANPTDGNILPASTRRFNAKWGDGELLPETASFFDNVSYQWHNFALGVYFANLDLTFGTSGSTSKLMVLFVFPWQLIIVMFILLGILFLILRNLVKRYNRFIISQIRSGKH